MTRILYEPKKFRLSMNGHAGAAPKGQDLVCAGLSTLWATLEENLTEDRETVNALQPYFVLGEGSASVECNPRDIRKCTEIFRVICTGFRILSEHYPENVSYTEY